LQFRIGCSGWSYTSWTGPFYPPNLENSDWLRFYSKVFDYVEIDSSFYRIPNEFMVKNWSKRTPDNFKFTAKFPKVITHDKQLVDVEDDVDLFLTNMKPLQEKTLALLIQLPPSLEIIPGLECLRNLVPFLDDSIDEKDFGKIQKDRVSEMNKWAREIKEVESGNRRGKNKEVSLAMIAANNHYAGFGPGTANMFRKMVGLSELSWVDQQQIQKHLQLRQLRQQQQKEKQDQHVSNSNTLQETNQK
jgi:hypothetical protein